MRRCSPNRAIVWLSWFPALTDRPVLVYATRYDFRLYSDFTFFLDDPVFGDMIEPTDGRTTIGSDGRTTFLHHLRDVRLQTRIGVQARADSIDNGLLHDLGRERLSTTVKASVAQSGIGLFVEEEARVTQWLTVAAGARLDRADVSVEDRLDDPSATGNNATGAHPRRRSRLV